MATVHLKPNIFEYICVGWKTKKKPPNMKKVQNIYEIDKGIDEIILHAKRCWYGWLFQMNR